MIIIDSNKERYNIAIDQHQDKEDYNADMEMH